MKKMIETDEQKALGVLCTTIRKDVKEHQFTEGFSELANAMRLYPHAPEPQNLMGILLECTGDKRMAMRHYRAAWALEPTYRPARQNIERCGSLSSQDAIAYDEADCVSKKTYLERVKLDEHF